MKSLATQSILRFRASIFQLIRNHLTSKGFIEVDTPLLFKSSPEGAKEFKVTGVTGNYSLPQSPQQVIFIFLFLV